MVTTGKANACSSWTSCLVFVWFQMVCILFCLLRNQCSAYYQQTSRKYPKNYCLDSAQFY